MFSYGDGWQIDEDDSKTGRLKKPASWTGSRPLNGVPSWVRIYLELSDQIKLGASEYRAGSLFCWSEFKIL